MYSHLLSAARTEQRVGTEKDNKARKIEKNLLMSISGNGTDVCWCFRSVVADKLSMFSLRQWCRQGPSVEPSVRAPHLSNVRMLCHFKHTPLRLLGRHGSRSPHCWRTNRKDHPATDEPPCCYPAITAGALQQTWGGWVEWFFFSFLNQHTLNEQLTLCACHFPSRELPADPQFLINFHVRLWYETSELKSYRTWRTQLAALQQEPAVSLRFAGLMVIHPSMPQR